MALDVIGIIFQSTRFSLSIVQNLKSKSLNIISTLAVRRVI